MKSAIALVVTLLAVWGCAPQYTLQKPERASIGTHYSVETPIAWSRLADGKVETWTVDGAALESLTFVAGVEDGDTLLKVPEAERSRTPKFRKGMTVLDAREFIESSMVASGAANLALRDFRTASFGSVPGFRAEMDYQTKEGLEKTGFLVGAIHNDRFHLILYTGARLHFHDKHKADAERIAASVVVNS